MSTRVSKQLGLVFTALFAYGIVLPLTAGWGVQGWLAQWVVAAAIAVTLFVPFQYLWEARTCDDYARLRRITPWLHGSLCAAAVLVTYWLIAESGASPLPVTVPLTVVVVVVSWLAWFDLARMARARIRRHVVTVDDPDDAEDLIARCRAELAGEVTEAERTTLELNLAIGLIALSARPDQADRLHEAVALLERAPADRSPMLVLAAAESLLKATEVKLHRTGDRGGYQDALDLVLDAGFAAEPIVPGSLARAQAARGMSLGRVSEAEPDEALAARLNADAVAALEHAVAGAAPGSDEQALRRIMLAWRRGLNPLRDDLDDAVRTCQRALARLWLLGADERAYGQLVLARLLELRAARAGDAGWSERLDQELQGVPSLLYGGLWPKRGENDLLRAMALTFRVASSTGPYASEARARMPVLRSAMLREKGWNMRRVARSTNWMFSKVQLEQSAARPGGAAENALQWARWAMEVGDAPRAAQAWWTWITAVSTDISQRVLEDKEHRVPRIQLQVAEAAVWMVHGGRAREAAVTLDLGRAVLLTERMQRDRVGLHERLLAAGRGDLAERWRQASEAMQAADRAAFGAPAPGPDGFGSDEYRTLAAYGRLLREIGELDGFEDVHALPDYDDLRAAAAEGPLVYLGTTPESGFALVVTADAAAPVAVPLPALARAAVDVLVDRLRDAETAADLTRALRDLLPELHAAVFQPLAPLLPVNALTTLIATGPLGELPLHAAACLPDERGVYHDHGEGRVFRYAPNARVLLRSQRIARDVGHAGLSALTAAVPHAPGEAALPQASVETRAVARLFGPDHSEALDPATVDALLQRLDRCQIWHFACHGVHDPAEPLRSRLLLADGALDLRTLFSRPGGDGRLAVLSACRTANVDGLRPDEVVGFPSALLQAGLAGVVSCQGEVHDVAAMLLVLRFFECFTRAPDVHPARALARAQAWLRTATNAELVAAFPGAYAKPADASAGWESAVPFKLPLTWVLFTYTGA